MAKYLCTCGHSRWEHKNGFKECCVSLMPNNTCTCKSFNPSVKEAKNELIVYDEVKPNFTQKQIDFLMGRQANHIAAPVQQTKPFELTDFDRSLLRLYSISAE